MLRTSWLSALPLLLAACTAPSDEVTFATGPILSSHGAPYGEDGSLTVIAQARTGILTGEVCRAVVDGAAVVFATPGELNGTAISDLTCTARNEVLALAGPVDPGIGQVRFIFN